MKTKQKGQSTVEYVMLLAVIVSICLGVYNKFFKRIFAEEGIVFGPFRRSMEHGYRHAFPGSLETPKTKNERYGMIHESYFDAAKKDTRFFFTRDYGN